MFEVHDRTGYRETHECYSPAEDAARAVEGGYVLAVSRRRTLSALVWPLPPLKADSPPEAGYL